MFTEQDPLRASPDQLQRVSARSRATWSSYAERVSNKHQLPPACVQLESILGGVPAYLAHRIADPSRLKLQHQKERGEVFLSGRSTWRTSEIDCGLGRKHLSLRLLHGIKSSTRCDFDKDSCFRHWPGILDGIEHAEDTNYLAVLAFAWAYILSARWVELQGSRNAPENAKRMVYLHKQAPVVQSDSQNESLLNGIEVDVGCVESDAGRWWAAILATGEGWNATTAKEGEIYRSPWSITIPSTQHFRLHMSGGYKPTSTSSHAPPSSEKALSFLSDFCVFHNIRGQCSAALAACMFFPFLRSLVVLLPLPRTRRCAGETPLSHSKCDDVTREGPLLPYYMSISCNIWGMRALLSGSFFDTHVYCNAVNPWLEPAFEILDPFVKNRDFVAVAAIMGERQPKLAALWLGASLTGVASRIIRDVHCGLSAIELHAAAWTRTTHTFIGPSVSASCIADTG